MASTTLLLKGSKDPYNIYIRFTEGRSIDIMMNTGLSVAKVHWDAKNKRIRNMIEITNRDEINSKLAKLQIGVIDQYNLDYTNGVTFNGTWLKNFIKSFFNRPIDEVKKGLPDNQIYLVDYCNYWLTEKAPKYKVKANKYMDERTIGQYEQAIKNLEKYVGKSKTRLTETTSDFMDGFSAFLTEAEKYAAETAKRKVKRIKFFIERAEGEGLAVHRGFKERVFVQEEDTDYKHPYLNEQEINAIYKRDLTHDKNLDNARDNLIIGVWTGLRISDFLTRLTIDNIDGDYIQIKTKKTGHAVSIPVHPMVKKILKKHNGLPPKMPEQKFNDRIKIVGQLAEIDDKIKGAIVQVDEKTKIKRKSVGLYKKHLLITSHICRRSFATNHFGKVSNKVLMDVCGWRSEDMLLKYIKATNMESAIALNEYWEKTYN